MTNAKQALLACLGILVASVSLIASREDLLSSFLPMSYVMPVRIGALCVASGAGLTAAVVAIWTAISVVAHRRRHSPKRRFDSTGRSSPPLIERAAQLRMIERLLDWRDVLCVSITGFKGEGKTALLEEAGRRALRARIQVFGPTRVGTLERLPDLLARVASLEIPSANPYEILQDFVESNSRKRFAVFLDDYPVNDQQFCSDLEWLLTSLRTAGANGAVWLAGPEQPKVDAPVRFESIGVGHLSENGTAEFVQRTWPDKYQQIDRICAATKGNPKFILLVCSSATFWERFVAGESRDFDPAVAVWDDVRTGPPELRDAIERLTLATWWRYDWNGELARRLVSGWDELNHAVVGRNLVDALDGGRFRVHDLLAAVVYRSLDADRRMKIHLQVGELLAESPDRHVRFVALNHVIAGKSGDRALALFSEFREQLRFRGISSDQEDRELVLQLSDMSSTDTLTQAELMEDVAFIDLRRSSYAEADGMLKEAASTYSALGLVGKAAWAEWGRACILKTTADFRAALEAFQEVQSKFQAAGDARGTAWSLREQAEALKFLGRLDEAASRLTMAGRLSRTAGDPQGKLDCFRGRADIERLRGNLRNADRRYLTAAKVAEKAEYKMGEAYALEGMAAVRRMRGQPGEARLLYGRMSELSYVMGDKDGLGVAANGIAALDRLDGDYDGARDGYMHAQAVLESAGSTALSCWSRLGLCEALRAKGQLAEANREATETIHQAQALELAVETLHARLCQIEVRRLEGRADRDEYESILQGYRQLGIRWGIMQCLVRLAAIDLPLRHTYLAEADGLAQFMGMSRVSLPHTESAADLLPLDFPY